MEDEVNLGDGFGMIILEWNHGEGSWRWVVNNGGVVRAYFMPVGIYRSEKVYGMCFTGSLSGVS